MEVKELSYEQAMEQLEQTLRRLDAGDLPLEEAISCFQEGLEYIKVCQAKLTAAEGTVKILRGETFVDMQESV
ncbi:MAG: exodeoxyribonuclease VII small subunit [Peptococcaceae bacterium]|nr:exodeoxyribonuclease VII small subunit [Peptococcaceae bacterium]